MTKLQKMNKIKYLRLKNNLKQKDLCDLLKITQPNYSNYENGKINLNKTYAQILARFYKVNISYIVNEENKKILISKEDFNTLIKGKEIIAKIVEENKNKF